MDAPTAMRATGTITTTAGEAEGVVRDGVISLKGLPFGADTSGAGRFRPPRAAAPWTGVRPALFYGPTAPQSPSTEGIIGRDGFAEDNFLLYRGSDGCIQDEDCLRLNAWAPVSASGPLPVMVYLHGGGFAFGSGNDLRAYDGANLARSRDVVVVTGNHRLNVLGYLDLASTGAPGWDSSVNLGMQDIVLMLEWVRDNIATVGGDPDNITVFGQSGGGGKVAALQSMPSAEGLFHKAIIQSGPGTAMQRDESRRLTSEVLERLEVDTANLAALADTDLPRLLTEVGGITCWAPCVDGEVIAEDFVGQPGAPRGGRSSRIPLLTGSNYNELTNAVDRPAERECTSDDVDAALEVRVGDQAGPLREAVERDHPGANPFAVRCAIEDGRWRAAAYAQYVSRADEGAPSYNYVFEYVPDVLDGRTGVYHSAEIAYVFNNATRCENQTGDTPGSRRMAELMSKAWAAFARTGSPSIPELPDWPSPAEERDVTMVFDEQPRLAKSLDAELIADAG